MHSSVSAKESNPRRIYVILSPKALAYAHYGIQTLLLNCLEPLDICLITDTVHDREALLRAQEDWNNPREHRIRILIETELADAESSLFSKHPHLREFRHGHPCWRKITDPLLIAGADDEIIILDPDLYFPNLFSFESTPSEGLLLMWQQPNCLLPPEVVRRAIDNHIPLARHIDIGVAHWRSSADLDWLNWLIGKLGASELPRAMHVEAIVWAAIAMHNGGGYLDPHYWKCWQRTAAKRLMRRIGVEGGHILALEPWPDIKCFHAGGEAKWWMSEIEKRGRLNTAAKHIEPGTPRPFVELTPERYDREELYKRVLHKLDLFHILR